MLEFFEEYGAQIVALLVALAGAATSVTSLIKAVKVKVNTDDAINSFKNDIKVTQEGIVEAFKKSKISTEWKVSISKQVDKILDTWCKKLTEQIEESERLRTELAIYNTRILSYTAAYNKLTEEEQAHIQNLLRELSDEDCTIEITDEGE